MKTNKKNKESRQLDDVRSSSNQHTTKNVDNQESGDHNKICTDLHFEEDLSFVYNLGGGDYSLASYTTYADDDEGEDGEAKALLLKVINDNKKQKEEHEEVLKRLEEQEKQNEEYKGILNSWREQESRKNMENKETIKRLEKKISQISASRSFKARALSESFEDDTQFHTNEFRDSSTELQRIENHEFSYDEEQPSFSLNNDWKSRSRINFKRKNVLMGFHAFSEDTYHLMMLSDGFFCPDWLLGFVVFLFQLGLGILTVYSQQATTESDFNDTLFQIPIRTKPEVMILQICSIFKSVYYQGDVFNAIALPIDLRLNGPHPWGGIPIEDDKKHSRAYWMSKILLPNAFKCLQGFIVLLAS